MHSGIQIDQLLKRAAARVISNDSSLQTKVQDHAKNLAFNIRFILTAHVDMMARVADIMPTSTTTARSDWQSSFERLMKQVLEEALLLQTKLYTSMSAMSTFWPEHGSAVKFGRMIARYKSNTVPEADLEVAFTTKPGVRIEGTIEDGADEVISSPAEVVTQRHHSCT